VGPRVCKDLGRSAALAVLAATLVMGVYIALRFELRFGIGAAIALVHDVLMTIGALAIAHMEFDLTTVAALLTVVGYSVHDTVIVSDRIRENMKKMRRESLATIMNVSINETLSRTLITSGTAILVTAALFVLGGPVIHSFAFVLLIAFIVGPYSSYDVDGMTGAAELVLCLRELGAEPLLHVSHRGREGYGLNADALGLLHAAGARVVVTADCGTADEGALAHAADLGLDVIVCDHHHAPTRRPPVLALLNPLQPGCAFPFKGLSGAGVVFYLLMGLRAELRARG